MDFDDFKDSFVRILCQTNVDEPLSDEEDGTDGDEESGVDSENEDEGEAGEKEKEKNEEDTSDAGTECG